MKLRKREILSSYVVALSQYLIQGTGSSVGKEYTFNAGDQGSIPGLGRFPGEGNSYTLKYSCLENSIDGPWGHKESDMTERLTHSLTSPRRRLFSRT